MSDWMDGHVNEKTYVWHAVIDTLKRLYGEEFKDVGLCLIWTRTNHMHMISNLVDTPAALQSALDVSKLQPVAMTSVPDRVN